MQFSPPGFSTVQDNSRSYQGFQEVTGFAGKSKILARVSRYFTLGTTMKIHDHQTEVTEKQHAENVLIVPF